MVGAGQERRINATRWGQTRSRVWQQGMNARRCLGAALLSPTNRASVSSGLTIPLSTLYVSVYVYVHVCSLTPKAMTYSSTALLVIYYSSIRCHYHFPISSAIPPELFHQQPPQTSKIFILPFCEDILITCPVCCLLYTSRCV